jgi:hypothetical protein
MSRRFPATACIVAQGFEQIFERQIVEHVFALHRGSAFALAAVRSHFEMGQRQHAEGRSSDDIGLLEFAHVTAVFPKLKRVLCTGSSFLQTLFPALA